MTPSPLPDLFRLASGSIYRWEFERRGKKLEINVPGRISLGRVDKMIDA